MNIFILKVMKTLAQPEEKDIRNVKNRREKRYCRRAPRNSIQQDCPVKQTSSISTNNKNNFNYKFIISKYIISLLSLEYIIEYTCQNKTNNFPK